MGTLWALSAAKALATPLAEYFDGPYRHQYLSTKTGWPVYRFPEGTGAAMFRPSTKGHWV